MDYHQDIVAVAKANQNFRTVVSTNAHSQVVVMSLLPGEDIGLEVHQVDQILVFVTGRGQAVLNGQTSDIQANHLVVVPAGTEHNFVNTGTEPMKLYTVYAPAEHRDGTVHATKADAARDEHDEPA